MDHSGQSLHDLFIKAKQRQDSLDHGDPRSQEYRSAIQKLQQTYEQCRNLISQLALFSTNEEIDDISTQNIQYLSVDYVLAELLLKSYDDHREKALGRALELFDAFLTRLDQYRVLSVADRRLYERFQEDKSSFSLAAKANTEERRKIKIARFQEEKELKAKLQYLRDQSQHTTIDDETTRSLYLAELALYSNQSFQSIDMTTQELSILSQARLADLPTELRGEDGRSPDHQPSTNGYSERLDNLSSAPGLGRYGAPLLDQSGKPLRPFTLTDKRTQLRRGVFRPDHNLPTMSIDEYLDEERRRGGIIDGGGDANEHPAEPDEDNVACADAQTMKAREWDEFVEANPKGAGNTLNRG